MPVVLKKSDFHVGMKFSQPVFFEDKANMFLAAKKPFLQYHFDCMDAWGIETLVTDGEIIPDDYEEEIVDLEALEELEELERYAEFVLSKKKG